MLLRMHTIVIIKAFENRKSTLLIMACFDNCLNGIFLKSYIFFLKGRFYTEKGEAEKEVFHSLVHPQMDTTTGVEWI